MLSNKMFVLKYSALFVLLFNTPTAQNPQPSPEENQTPTQTNATIVKPEETLVVPNNVLPETLYIPDAPPRDEKVDFDFESPVTGRSIPKELQDMFKMAGSEEDNAAYCMRQYSECLNVHTLKPICATNAQLSKRMFRSICEMMHENCRYDSEQWHYIFDDECDKKTTENPTKESTNIISTEKSTTTTTAESTNTTIAEPTETTTVKSIANPPEINDTKAESINI